MKTLLECFEEVNAVRYTEKSFQFLKTYHELFADLLGKPVRLLEIGIGSGGSLKMWKEYFGPRAEIYGADKVERKDWEEIGAITRVVDQADRRSLRVLAQDISIPPLDVIIDDGSHKCQDQINTLEELFSALVDGGFYICEDTHTSYRENYQGGYKRPGTFIEYCKDLIDSMEGSEDPRIPASNLANSIESIIFLRSMIIIKKVKY